MTKHATARQVIAAANRFGTPTPRVASTKPPPVAHREPRPLRPQQGRDVSFDFSSQYGGAAGVRVL